MESNRQLDELLKQIDLIAIKPHREIDRDDIDQLFLLATDVKRELAKPRDEKSGDLPL